jgi:hypothetical protein
MLATAVTVAEASGWCGRAQALAGAVVIAATIAPSSMPGVGMPLE